MKPIIAIADDLTGAAEIAGIGRRFGLDTRLFVECSAFQSRSTQLTVINSDTRAMPLEQARHVVQQIVSRIDADALLFKKVDSVMRGQLAGEIDAILDSTPRFDRVLLIPQNPTRRRIIRADGMYLVEGTPLAETHFAIDPDHPARTSNVLARMAAAARQVVLIDDNTSALTSNKIHIGVAEKLEAIHRRVALRTPSTLLAGAADLFMAVLMAEGWLPRAQTPEIGLSGRRLHLCGSTSLSSRRALRSYASRHAIEPIAPDATRAIEYLRQQSVAVVMSPEPGGIEAEPRDIEAALASCGRDVVKAGACDWIFAEGGATSAALCREMGWTTLEVQGELASGVVVLKPQGTVRLVIKPGSYTWPSTVL